MTDRPNGLTYAEAGVDIDAGNALVERIKPAAAATARPGVMAGLGGFGALFDLKAAGYADPVLVAATDGVGTKLRLAIDTGRLDTRRHRPRGDVRERPGLPGRRAAVLPRLFRHRQARGRRRGARSSRASPPAAREAGAALVGGETAEMPGMYAGGDFDLAGFAVGAMERGGALPRGVAAGDVLLGLASSGVHSNGFSLVRRIVADGRPRLGRAPRPFGDGAARRGAAGADAHLRPAGAGGASRAGGVHGARAHHRRRADREPAARPARGRSARRSTSTPGRCRRSSPGCASSGGIADAEMLKTFNCGIGMVAVVAPERAAALADVLRDAGETRDADRPRRRPAPASRYSGRL